MKPKQKKKRLMRRVHDYNAMLANMRPENHKAYRCPGSNKK